MQKEAKEELGCTFENMHCILDQQISYIRIWVFCLNMKSGLHSIFSVIVITQFILGNLNNGLVVVINVIDWVTQRKLFSVDQILVILSTSRIGLIWEIVVSWFETVQYSFLPLTSVSGLLPSSASFICSK
jgi:hypothetical protein